MQKIAVYGCGKVGKQIVNNLTLLNNAKKFYVFPICSEDLYEQLAFDLHNKSLVRHSDEKLDVIYFCASVPRDQLPPNATMNDITIANAKVVSEFCEFVGKFAHATTIVFVITNPVDAIATVLQKRLRCKVVSSGLSLDVRRYQFRNECKLAVAVGFHGFPFVIHKVADPEETAEAAKAGFNYVMKFKDNVVFSIARAAVEDLLMIDRPAVNVGSYSAQFDIVVGHPDLYAQHRSKLQAYEDIIRGQIQLIESNL